MNILRKYKSDNPELLKYQEKVKDLNSRLNPYREKFEKEVSELLKLEQSFKRRVDDFFNEERKLRLAVIGQVKAGKSTFLNNLLFNGEDVLPRAATPKTATLTIIQYGETNSIEIEFYAEDEWKDLISLSKIDGDSDEIKVAKEIVNMMNERDIDSRDYIGNEPLVKEFNSYEELLGRLNDYAGENGEFTPIVKSLRLYINDENIKGLEIVDTPGLNDPITARTDKTRQYIELCDVVFFLSQASSFLDSTDMELLGRQLPQKGVNKMVLLASKYDSAILDVVWDSDSLDEAEVEVKTSLKSIAKRNFGRYVENLKAREVDELVIKTIEDGSNPMFVSSMTYNMSKKTLEEFSDEERNIYEGLSENQELTSVDLKRIGNFEVVLEEFEDVIEKKEQTLEEKASTFLRRAESEFADKLNEIESKLSKRVEILSRNDIEGLKKEEHSIMLKKNGIASDIETVFGKLEVKIEKEKADATRNLRDLVKDYSNVNERTGSEQKTRSHRVSTSKWYNPFSWGSYKTQYSTYTETYSYLDVSDIVENLRNYGNDSASRIEQVFNETVDFNLTKRELLSVIVNHFDTASDMFDPGYFRLIVERTLNSMEIPIINIDIQKETQNILGEFTGEIRDSSKKTELKLALSNSIGEIFNTLEKRLLKEMTGFKQKVNDIKDSIAEELLTDIAEELNIIASQFEDKEKELELNKECLGILRKYK